jgi:hypothetical protein
MRHHLSDGELRSHLDSELADDQAQHLAGCAECQSRLAPLAARRATATDRLAAVAPASTDPALAAGPALARFQSRFMQPEKVSMFNSLFRKSLRPLWTTLAVVVMLAGALAFEPVRAWAGQFLGLFRVQQVTVLPIDTTGLSALAGDEALGEQIAQVMSQAITYSQEPGEPQAAASAEEASHLAGFPVRVLDTDLSGPKFMVSDSAAFELTLERAEAQAIIDELGRGELKLPASVDGARISVNIPAGVTSAYGDCAALSEPEREGGPARGLSVRNCVLLAQMPSPVVNTPPDLDVAQLAEIGLQLTGMSAAEAHAFVETVDWGSTLVIPVPRNGHQYRQVPVDGVTGYLIYRVADDGVPARYTIVWVKAGIVYGLSGFGPAETGLALANSLQ